MPVSSILIATTSRADFGIYQPIILELLNSEKIAPSLLVSGDHVPLEGSENQRRCAAKKLARSVQIPLSSIVPMRLGEGNVLSITRAIGEVTIEAGEQLAKNRPDMLLVLGDRYEMHAIVVAASVLRIPVAHIHGGEESEGAIDNLYRHSMTKMSHLHFCATQLSQERILAMGEEPWRVHCTGAPGLDNLENLMLDDRITLLERLDIPDEPFLLATFHPETLDVENSLSNFKTLLEVLDERGLLTVFSRANSDEAGQAINELLEEYSHTKSWLYIRDNLGRRGYFSAMSHAEAMIGNSSSGIIEAASFGLPVVNIGNRQAGREKSCNTIDAAINSLEITNALNEALSKTFRSKALNKQNVYKIGSASTIIRHVLETITFDRQLITKRFKIGQSVI